MAITHQIVSGLSPRKSSCPDVQSVPQVALFNQTIEPICINRGPKKVSCWAFGLYSNSTTINGVRRHG